jgi:carboxymethylenebutenolidase
MMSGLISGFTLAVERVEAQTITTDTNGLDAGETKIPTSDGELPAYYARPAKGTHFPIVIVNEEIFGVHEHIKDLCRRLAKVGYLAVATEYYARIGDLSKMTDIPTIIKDVISKAPDAQYLSDATPPSPGPARTRATSTCGGDRLLPRRAPDLVDRGEQQACEGGGRLVRAGPEPDVRHPAKDRHRWRRPVEMSAARAVRRPGCEHQSGRRPRRRSQGEGGPQDVEIVVYPDAPHGFNADYRPSYRKDAAEDGWKRMLAWFAAHGVKPAKV